MIEHQVGHASPSGGRQAMPRSIVMALRIVAAVVCCALVWFVTIGRGSSELDDLAIGAAVGDGGDVIGPIYLVEVNSRPDYRIIRFDPSTGTSVPIFQVPEFGVISSIALSPSGEELAMAYSRDYREPAVGIFLIDLTASEGELIVDDLALEVAVAEMPDTFYDDLQYGPDGSMLWASVERDDELAVVAIDVATGNTVETYENAVEPAVDEDRLVYLVVEPDESRRSVGVVERASGATSTVEVLEGRFDLGNLVLGEDGQRVLLTALVPPDQPGLRIGEPAEAHGSHDGPSQWLTVDLESGRGQRLVEHDPLTVRDVVVASTGELMISTVDGLASMRDPLTPLLASRAITELAG